MGRLRLGGAARLCDRRLVLDVGDETRAFTKERNPVTERLATTVPSTHGTPDSAGLSEPWQRSQNRSSAMMPTTRGRTPVTPMPRLFSHELDVIWVLQLHAFVH